MNEQERNASGVEDVEGHAVTSERPEVDSAEGSAKVTEVGNRDGDSSDRG